MYSVLLGKINFSFPYIKDELEDDKLVTKNELIDMCNQGWLYERTKDGIMSI